MLFGQGLYKWINETVRSCGGALLQICHNSDRVLHHSTEERVKRILFDFWVWTYGRGGDIDLQGLRCSSLGLSTLGTLIVQDELSAQSLFFCCSHVELSNAFVITICITDTDIYCSRASLDAKGDFDYVTRPNSMTHLSHRLSSEKDIIVLPTSKITRWKIVHVIFHLPNIELSSENVYLVL